MPALVMTAVRLGAVEALAPTAAVLERPGATFPTLAGAQVYDSRAVPVDLVKSATASVATIGVYTEVAKGEPRGNAQFSVPINLVVDLVLEAELVIRRRVGEDEGVMPADSDPAAEMMLDFLVVQARRAIVQACRGGILRGIVKQIVDVEAWPLRLPEVGVRLARRTLRLRCAVDDDEWTADGGLPEPLRTLRAQLDDESYAAAGLDRIAAAIAAPAPLTMIEAITYRVGDFGGADDAALRVDGGADGVADVEFEDGVLGGTGYPGAEVTVEV